MSTKTDPETETEPGGETIDDDDAPASDRRPSVPPAIPPRLALPVALAVTAVTAGALWYGFHQDRAGTWDMLIALAGVYTLTAAAAIWALRREGKIAVELRPKGGDLTFGAAVAGLMYGVAMAGRTLVAGAESPRSWWVARVYLQLGDMSNNRILYVGVAVLGIAALEELTWRGLVMRSLKPGLGPARAWLASSFLYALAHAATVSLLAHPVAGPNPLLVAAAFGGGLVWGHLYNRTGRLLPGVFAHALFSWAIVEFPLWRLPLP